MRRKSFCAAFLAFALLGSAAAAQTTVPDGTSESPIPQNSFAGVEPLVEALAVEESAAILIDMFWEPAIAALVAANPDRADAARAFAAGLRARELTVYPALVAMMLDRQAVPRLYPKNGALTDPAEVNALFGTMAALAATEDGRELTALLRQGYFLCAPGVDRATAQEHAAACETLGQNPALQRLRSRAGGEDLILIAGAAFRHLVGMIQMGHAAGISLHRLLPPDAVRAAGLVVPPDRSDSELLASALPKATDR